MAASRLPSAAAAARDVVPSKRGGDYDGWSSERRRDPFCRLSSLRSSAMERLVSYIARSDDIVPQGQSTRLYFPWSVKDWPSDHIRWRAFEVPLIDSRAASRVVSLIVLRLEFSLNAVPPFASDSRSAASYFGRLTTRKNRLTKTRGCEGASTGWGVDRLTMNQIKEGRCPA
jgi:hypothetical protein